MKQRKVLRENPDAAPEMRLHPLLYRKFFQPPSAFSIGVPFDAQMLI